MFSPWGYINTSFQIENGKPLNDPFKTKKRRESMTKNEIFEILKSLLENSNNLELE